MLNKHIDLKYRQKVWCGEEIFSPREFRSPRHSVRANFLTLWPPNYLLNILTLIRHRFFFLYNISEFNAKNCGRRPVVQSVFIFFFFLIDQNKILNREII